MGMWRQKKRPLHPPPPSSLSFSPTCSHCPYLPPMLPMFLQSGQNPAAASPEQQLLHTNEELRGGGGWCRSALVGNSASTSVLHAHAQTFLLPVPPRHSGRTEGVRGLKVQKKDRQATVVFLSDCSGMEQSKRSSALFPCTVNTWAELSSFQMTPG